MKKIKRSYLIIIVIVVCVLLVSSMGIVYFGEKSSAVPTISQKVITIPEADRKEQTKIVLMQEASKVSGTGARIDGNKVTINKGGTYLVSGTLEEGQIYVEADKTDIVILLLQGAKIMNSLEAVIEVEKAGHVSIQLAQNTENELQSGKKVDVTEAEVDKEAKGAAVYARSDLSVTGEGSCKILGYINNAIQTKDNLLIDNATLTIEACNNGMNAYGGQNSMGGGTTKKTDEMPNLRILDGTLSINAEGDGIDSNGNLEIILYLTNHKQHFIMSTI